MHLAIEIGAETELPAPMPWYVPHNSLRVVEVVCQMTMAKKLDALSIK